MAAQEPAPYSSAQKRRWIGKKGNEPRLLPTEAGQRIDYDVGTFHQQRQRQQGQHPGLGAPGQGVGGGVLPFDVVGLGAGGGERQHA